jgi:ribosomal protein S18 acetylase RimI-like enzyme
LQKIIFDRWLSKIIGKPAYKFEDLPSVFDKKFSTKKKFFLWSKIPVKNIRRLGIYQKKGFFIIDTNIHLESTSIISQFKNNEKVRFAEPKDEHAIRQIAKGSFKFSRFHLDTQIPTFIANKIKEEWAANYFKGERGKWMIVIEHEKKIEGFLQLLKKNHNTIIIDLIAVNTKFRGKGFAKSMISYAYYNCTKNINRIEVGTQISNTESIDLYTKLGFRITSASYMLHMHK